MERVSQISKEKKIALLFNKPGVYPGFERVVSAHIQLPMQTAKLMQKSGIDCVIITTQLPANQVLPSVFNEINYKSIYFVPDLNKQGRRSAALEGQRSGVKILKTFAYIISVIKAVNKNNINVLHVFGTKKFILLAVLFKVLLPRLKLIWTTENRCEKSYRFIDYLINKFVCTLITTTEYVKSTCKFHHNVRLIRPGIARNFIINNDVVKKRVLFWRDASPENGADIALKVFRNLASEFRDIIFTFAVRPHWNAVVNMSSCDKDNIEYLEYPYKNGNTIDKLLSESICVVFPFRELSTNPQLVVIETLNAGVPVICSSIESNEEILKQVGLNFGLGENVVDYVTHLKGMLYSHTVNKKINVKCLNNLNKRYNWKEYLTGCLSIYDE
jgi:glycosyltransferase involved in cell wall biosynthesis